MSSFKPLTDHAVYTKVTSRAEAQELAEEAKKISQKGETVVIFFENRYHLHLAPGQDPYQISQAIEDWQNKQPQHVFETITPKKKLLTNKVREQVQAKKKTSRGDEDI